MLEYVLRRIVATIPVLLLVAIIVFSLLYLAPGDPAAVLAGDQASAEEIARIRSSLGLDQSFLQRFLQWGGGVLRGDLGQSVFSGRPVTSLIAQRLEPTIALTVLSLLVALLIAIPLGVLAAWKPESWLDRGAMGFAVLGFSVPVFVLSYCLILLLAVALPVLPVQGYKPLMDGIGPFLRHMILPAFALGVLNAALIARTTRAAMLEVLRQDYIRTAQAKGLPVMRVLIGHALKNAAIPIVTIIGISFAMLISGVVVTETVFNIPGVGRLTVDAILRRDYPVIQGVILLFSVAYVLLNLLIDLSYGLFDPRIRL
ncbi:MAG: ABC transporter permease [Erythrobacter sp.]|nr:ABC transporter permease [Erythrobacter sp.]MDZ4276300.1 ABC transporter permease [Erythrobacter sp.]